MIRWATTFVLAAVLFWGSPTHAGTIVFDFEDGLQGWELFGSVQRVQTQLLGGEWAIFGDGLVGGGALISIPLDQVMSPLSIEWDVFFVEGEGAVTSGFTRLIPGCDVCVVLQWGLLGGGSTVVAFIDNITFHTIPEPSVLGMLVMGGVIAGAHRRRRT